MTQPDLLLNPPSLEKKLSTAALSLIYAFKKGTEFDLYECTNPILSHAFDCANSLLPAITRFSFGPQGNVRLEIVGPQELFDNGEKYDEDYTSKPSKKRGENWHQALARSQQNKHDTDLAKKLLFNHSRDTPVEAPDSNITAPDNTSSAADRPRRGLETIALCLVKKPSMVPRTIMELKNAENQSPKSVPPLSSASTDGGSTPKKIKSYRLPDFLASLLFVSPNGVAVVQEIDRFVVALVEVKFLGARDFPPDALKNYTVSQYKLAIVEKMDKMLPQVIQAVQFEFARKQKLKQLASIQVVNEYCRFLYFRRKSDDGKGVIPDITLPGLQRDGYRSPPQWKLSSDQEKIFLKETFYKTSATVPMIECNRYPSVLAFADQIPSATAYSEGFIEVWEDFVRWTGDRDLFPDPRGREWVL
ncbi:uncharacterized protein BXZ73DRAFT_79713 [Epithele typhae]|uniref:uncharacterized protein n=1 Tax=Epithele typhae TaxID=378194 RepID=UPI002007DF70|nr:uncharacterized protein BXZ73DRAFT_79713 [Epithele typhae]KAH9922315.1 hypothetical protein BXZ73DRAFT_79713 [Epithele typhae]